MDRHEPVQGCVDPVPRCCLLVLGMHRSGTSALTRTFGLLGVDLPANLLAPAPDNVTGFWEPKAFVSFHEAMLERLGSSWDDWRTIDFTAIGMAERRAWKAKIFKLIDDEFGNSNLFVL